MRSLLGPDIESSAALDYFPAHQRAFPEFRFLPAFEMDGKLRWKGPFELA
jgi:hypothetical protein